jgi:DNA-directed RNA polymerase subunit RPC12/RpoP
MECPKCRREIKTGLPVSDLIYCPYCGENMFIRPEEDFSFCPACGQKLPPGSIFCLRCGKGLKVIEKPCRVESPQQRTMQEEFTGQGMPPGDRYVAYGDSEKEYAQQEEPDAFDYEYKPVTASEPVWPKIQFRIVKLVEPVRDLVTGKWRMRQLYRKWAQNGDLAPEEIPSSSELNRMAKDESVRPVRQNRMLLVAVCALAFIVFFVIIGILMSRCG